MSNSKNPASEFLQSASCRVLTFRRRHSRAERCAIKTFRVRRWPPTYANETVWILKHPYPRTPKKDLIVYTPNCLSSRKQMGGFNCCKPNNEVYTLFQWSTQLCGYRFRNLVEQGLQQIHYSTALLSTALLDPSINRGLTKKLLPTSCVEKLE